eukprot:CAMPEP_0196572754 /NCGR_PEP_ID=MMETSP1081-20130531/2745_1 /TAXON_ID=36882 /ORGANISM="Pyramimonas amylifera, Strain CCMP720" /LENGTH=205 /DNA_ID=CAMNT_0041890179 /DNA_START=214 /DNA_END=828 /DNA_ORIENTATION=-
MSGNVKTLVLVGGICVLVRYTYKFSSKYFTREPEYAGLSGVVPFSACKIAAWRALEAELGTQALFSDPLAADLAGPQALRAVRHAKQKLFGMPHRLAIRTRFFDDALQEALKSMNRIARENSYVDIVARTFSGTSVKSKPAPQVVLLGAGMDTRCFRLPEGAADSTQEGEDQSEGGNRRRKLGSVMFEVDLPEVLRAKQQVLMRV